jgi:hypothetical protein
MFRFTIRELVLLTLVVAMGIGWWLERQRLVSSAVRVKALEAAVTDHEATILRLMATSGS